MKLKHIALIGSLFPILFSIVLFFGVLISADSDDENSNFSSGITGMNLSAEVLKHQPMVEKYARENGISEYVNVLLAIIQVESGGTAEDVMQSSESLGLPPNSLDTESSIKQGCKYFASLLSSCKNQGIDDLNVAIQSYNYGGGYVGYVAGKGKKHTFNLAESFAREKSGGKKVTYTNPIAVAKPIIVNAGFDQDFKMTAEQLENAITEKTKMLILCSPSNPTGSVYSKEELAALAEVLKKHPEVFVLADEIYEHINYIGKHHSIAQEPGMKEQVIIANGVSKAYAMTGWRIGFLAGPEWIIKGCNKLQGQYTSGTCSVSQKAAEAAYTLDQSAVEEMRVAFERRRNLIVKLAKEVPGLEVNMPQGAFYLFPKCNSYFGKSNGEKTINNSTDFAMYLLEEAHVATVGGDAFGDPDCFRMSYATSDENIVEAWRSSGVALSLILPNLSSIWSMR